MGTQEIVGGQADEDITCMGNGRIGQHTLDIRLSQCRQITYDHREHRRPPQQLLPVPAEIRNDLIKDSQESNDCRSFGRNCKVGHNRNRGSFIHVRRPDMKRRKCGFEAKSNDYQADSQNQNRRVALHTAYQFRNFEVLSTSRRSINQGNPVKKKAG